jgi:DNA-binding GntR family transcriptional regulator
MEACGGSYSAFESRVLMEPWIAGIAALRADENDIAALKKTCARMKTALEHNDMDLYIGADLDFHRSIACACKNEFITHSISRAIDAEKFTLWHRAINWPTAERMGQSTKEHMNVLDAIIAGNPEGAIKAMEQHFTFHWWEVERAIETISEAD